MQFEEADEKLGKARIAIFGVAGLLLVNYVIASLKDNDNYVMVEGGVLVAIFAGHGIFAGKNPYAATLTALILYGLLIIAYAMVDPITIIGGLIWKIAIIASLVYGLKAASEAKQLKQKLSSVTFDLNTGVPKQ